MASSTSEVPSRSERSVLIVEDEWIIADEMRRILVSGGYEVAGIARSAEEFLQRASEAMPSLVLLDLHLAGGGDGVEVAARVCAMSPIPIVIVSGHSDAATVGRIVRAIRPAGFVVKPFSAAQLLATVALAVAGSELRVEEGRTDSAGASPAMVQDALRKIAGVLVGLGMVPGEDGTREKSAIKNVPQLELLSVREREVVEQLAKHRRVGWVASALHISEHTVRNHLKAIYWKLDVHSQDELLAMVLDEPVAKRRART